LALRINSDAIYKESNAIIVRIGNGASVTHAGPQ